MAGNTERDRQITIECLQGKTFKELATKHSISTSRIRYVVLGNCRRYCDTHNWQLSVKQARQNAPMLIARMKEGLFGDGVWIR